jgi:hypothetical protein
MKTSNRTIPLRPLLLAAACVLAFPTVAADRCEHSRTETPALDLAGITRVVVDIGADELVATAGAPSLAVKHCASTAERLAASTLTVERRGDTLLIDASSAGVSNFNWFADNDYLYREITLALPADLPITLDMGSGDAALSGLSDISIDLGSGDVSLRQVGAVKADIGSGDLVVDGATRVSVDVGSGDAVLKRVQGEVRASVGAGDVEMDDVGPLASLEAGSGNISARGVRGDARIASVGSGDIGLRGVTGRVEIGSVGSGDVALDDVGGDVIVADKDTLENVDTRGVRGRVVVGG